MMCQSNDGNDNNGNDVPKFRGNEEEMKKLDKLVSDLLPICSCKYFGPQSYTTTYFGQFTGTT